MLDYVYEVHCQVREYGHRTWQVYAREDHGQLRLVADYDASPWDSAVDDWRRMLRMIALDFSPHGA